uniref:hypothetical protein n=1 Tax=Parerythrobacter lutipelagi TaxID=1964208 RepID=UPI0010F48F71|nr:hypothetical protein [Parerythrobacter lutipelagi]
MSYQPSGAPWRVAIGLVVAAIGVVLGVAGYQNAKTASFKAALAQFARDNGLETIDWAPMHGIHDLYIGETFVADTPAKETAAICAVRQTDEITRNPNAQAPRSAPTLEIWFSASWLEADTLVFRSGSD